MEAASLLESCFCERCRLERRGNPSVYICHGRPTWLFALPVQSSHPMSWSQQKSVPVRKRGAPLNYWTTVRTRHTTKFRTANAPRCPHIFLPGLSVTAFPLHFLGPTRLLDPNVISCCLLISRHSWTSECDIIPSAHLSRLLTAVRIIINDSRQAAHYSRRPTPLLATV